MNIRYRRDLYKLIADMPGHTAEIGVAEGLFSADMLRWHPTRRHYMVDTWCCVPTQKGDAANPQEWHDNNYAQAQRSSSAFGGRAIILRGNSIKMAELVT